MSADISSHLSLETEVNCGGLPCFRARTVYWYWTAKMEETVAKKRKKEKKKKKRSEIGKWARKCTVSCWLSVASSWWSGQILRLPRHVCMLSKTGLNDVFSLPHMHLLWTLTAPQVTFKNNASFVYISNNSHFSFKLKKAKYFCMLLAEFHNQVWFVFLGPSYL